MPSSVYINEKLALRVQRHTGNVSLSEFEALIQLYRANRHIFLYDVIHILDDGTVFDFTINDLPSIKEKFRELVEDSKLPLILRSAWVCPSPQAWSVLEAWLHERHSLDGLHTEPCLVGALDEVAGLFDGDEIRAVQSMTGFRQYFSA